MYLKENFFEKTTSVPKRENEELEENTIFEKQKNVEKDFCTLEKHNRKKFKIKLKNFCT